MPMGKYRSFNTCVRAASRMGKGNPRAYCGRIYWRTEGKPTQRRTRGSTGSRRK